MRHLTAGMRLPIALRRCPRRWRTTSLPAHIATLDIDDSEPVTIVGDDKAALAAAAGTGRVCSKRNRPLARFTRILADQLARSKNITFEHEHAH